MSLLCLPPELRLRIYDYIPHLQPLSPITINSFNPNIPAISLVNALLYSETIPLFASNSLFSVQIEDAPGHPLARWMETLGPSHLSQVRSLLLSRHWRIAQPMRWQGHVGFYVRIERPTSMPNKSMSDSMEAFPAEWSDRFVKPVVSGVNTGWDVTTGTYPVSKDIRGLRLESVELLASMIRDYLGRRTFDREDEAVVCEGGLRPQDVHFISQAIDIVATHPIPTYHSEQDESGRRQRSEVWDDMHLKLVALGAGLAQPEGSSQDR